MNLTCLFGHKWNYKTEHVVVYPPKVITSSTMFGTGYYSGPCDGNGNPLPVEYNREVRRCIKCKKKEKQDKQFLLDSSHPMGEWVTKWIDCELTKEDTRDDKLEEIGI